MSSEDWPAKSATALDIAMGADLRDKWAVVTGANTGIGLETARALAHAGAHVVMACRNAVAAGEAKDRIVSTTDFPHGEAKISIMKLDCASFASAAELVAEYRRTGWPLHFLVLNAGIFGAPERLTKDGLEITVQVNHLSQYYIAWELRELLVSSAPARVVFVSSEAHRATAFLNSHLNWTPESMTRETLSPAADAMTGGMHAYGVSKLCNVLAALHFNKELESRGVTAYSLHPGFVRTEVGRSMNAFNRAVLSCLHRIVAKTPETGASTTLVCCLNPRLPKAHGGEYFDNNRPRLASPAGQRLDNAAKLHDLTMDLVKELRERIG